MPRPGLDLIADRATFDPGLHVAMGTRPSPRRQALGTEAVPDHVSVPDA